MFGTNGFSALGERVGLFAVALAFGAALSATPVQADESSATQPVDSEAGLGIAAGLVSLVYTPAKVLYALGGGAVAGMAYLASAGDQDVTEPILTPSLRGDYVVTPEHLKGERSLEFFGREEITESSTPPVSAQGDGLDGNTASAGERDAESEEPTLVE
jgi:hypothetical protein